MCSLVSLLDLSAKQIRLAGVPPLCTQTTTYVCLCFDVWFDALVILPAPQLAPSAWKYQKKGRDDHVAVVAAIW